MDTAPPLWSDHQAHGSYRQATRRLVGDMHFMYFIIWYTFLPCCRQKGAKPINQVYTTTTPILLLGTVYHSFFRRYVVDPSLMMIETYLHIVPFMAPRHVNVKDQHWFAGISRSWRNHDFAAELLFQPFCSCCQIFSLPWHLWWQRARRGFSFWCVSFLNFFVMSTIATYQRKGNIGITTNWV